MGFSFLWKVWAHSSKLFQAANKPKVHVPQAQDPMVHIGELVKALNLYSNPRVGNHSHVKKKKTPMLMVHLKSFGCKMLNLIESF